MQNQLLFDTQNENRFSSSSKTKPNINDRKREWRRFSFSEFFSTISEPAWTFSSCFRSRKESKKGNYHLLLFPSLLVELMGQKHSQSDVTIDYLWYRLIYDQIASWKQFYGFYRWHNCFRTWQWFHNFLRLVTIAIVSKVLIGSWGYYTHCDWTDLI